MSEELEKLQKLSGNIKRLNAKVILYTLINEAKKEYDSYNFEACREKLISALQDYPNNSVVLRGLGCLEQFDKNYEKALEYFYKALDFSQNKEIEYTLIGMVYYIQNNLEEAVSAFNKAIDSNEDYEKAYEGRNQAMLEKHIDILDLQNSLENMFSSKER